MPEAGGDVAGDVTIYDELRRCGGSCWIMRASATQGGEAAAGTLPDTAPTARALLSSSSPHHRLVGCGAGSIAHGREVLGQAMLSLAKDLDDSLPIGEGEPAIPLVLFIAREDLPHAPVDRLFRLSWQTIKCPAVNHETAGITQEPFLQIKLPQ
jgi:hypothetical protein